jgi:hypothetical protein
VIMLRMARLLRTSGEQHCSQRRRRGCWSKPTLGHRLVGPRIERPMGHVTPRARCAKLCNGPEDAAMKRIKFGLPERSLRRFGIRSGASRCRCTSTTLTQPGL